jgi:hypothetical protein
MADSDEKKFTVTDRRSFDPSGESKAPVAPAPEARPAHEAAPTKPAESPRHLPPADFATLVLSLGSSAVMYLGQQDDQDDQGQEGGQPTPPNLPMAKHAIDLLTVLEEKTKGNLTSEEQQILESLLFDLRLRYVEALKVGGAKS